MNRQSHLEPKYRTKFKQSITSFRSLTTDTHNPQSVNMTLSEISFKNQAQQENRKIHTLSKQSFITNKKLFILSRKLFFTKNQPKTVDQFKQEPAQATKFTKHYTEPSYEDLTSSKLIQPQEVFNVSEEVMKNAFSFHRNMISKIKDDKGTKNILKRWYNDNVSGNIQKLRKIQNYEKEKLEYSTKSASYIELQKRLKKENQKKTGFFKDDTGVRNSSCPKVNERALKKYSSCSTTPSKKSESADQLTKLIVRIQPFWYKVRIKI